MNGVKYDEAKPRTDLLDADWLEEVARVMGHGAQKYAAHNWRGGLAASRLLGALLRHTFAVLRGEDLDPESGLSHIGHLSCCAMFLYWTLKYRKELDDRFKYSSEGIDQSNSNGREVLRPSREAIERDPFAIRGTSCDGGFEPRAIRVVPNLCEERELFYK